MWFFSNLVKRRKQREYIAGYDWAAGVLLRGELSPQEVNVSTFGDWSHHFDKGAMDALRRLDGLGFFYPSSRNKTRPNQ